MGRLLTETEEENKKRCWGGPFKKAVACLKASKYQQPSSKELNVDKIPLFL
jgi:hypothetical protein